jgi:hypothetical protein
VTLPKARATPRATARTEPRLPEPRSVKSNSKDEDDFPASDFCEGSETLSRSQAVDRKARQLFAEYELASEVIDSPYVKPA